MKNNILLAVQKAGGTLAAAQSIGVSAPTVSQWISGDRPLPGARVIPIARATGWAVTPHEINPILYPHPDDGLPVHLRGAAPKGDAP